MGRRKPPHFFSFNYNGKKGGELLDPFRKRDHFFGSRISPIRYSAPSRCSLVSRSAALGMARRTSDRSDTSSPRSSFRASSSNGGGVKPGKFTTGAVPAGGGFSFRLICDRN